MYGLFMERLKHMSQESTNTPIHPAQKVFVELSAELQTVINEARSDVNKLKGFSVNDELLIFKVLLLLFLCKATGVCQSFIAVLSSDPTLWREATALLRTLLELCVYAKYMDKEPAKLSARFLRYDAVWKYKFKERISSLSDEMKKMFDRNIEKNEFLESEYEKYIEDYGKEVRTWSGISFTDMLQEVFEDSKNTWLYHYLFKIQCNYLHVSTSSLEEYFHEIEHGFELSREAQPQDIDRTLIVAIVLFLILYETCDKNLDFGREKWLEDFQKRLAEQRNITIE